MDILACPTSLQGEYISLKIYLLKMLEALVEQGEGFSGKRPLGNSGWKFDLIKEGYLPGVLDEEEGYVIECDTKAADKLLLEAVRGLMQ